VAHGGKAANSRVLVITVYDSKRPPIIDMIATIAKAETGTQPYEAVDRLL
jgi:hypothetical protein